MEKLSNYENTNKLNAYLEFAKESYPRITCEELIEAILRTNYKNDTEDEVKEQIIFEVRKLKV